MSIHVGNCPRCDINARLRFRDFSDQAITALVVWGEMEEKVVSQPICDDCHDELREILIERNEEIFSPKKPEAHTIVARKDAPVPQQRTTSAAKPKPAAKAEAPAPKPAAKAEKVAKPAAKAAKPAPKPAKKAKVTAGKKKIKRAG